MQFNIRYPIVLILLPAAYLFLTFIAALACNRLGQWAAWVLWQTEFSQPRHPNLAYHVSRLLFFGVGSLIWLHYLRTALLCFWAAVNARTTSLGAAQLVAVTVFFFAVAHYYVALFADAKAYSGIENPKPPTGWIFAGDFDERMFFWPGFEKLLDFLYFSTVTTATVGYGDVYPMSVAAKILTILQIGLSFVLVVVIVGWIIGHSDLFNKSGDKKER
ncbi:MAG TPA: potassium channel family protein [Bradyrhizobium sp.]|nr:potassium channel family protein [Bradyrhizobium sp.]